jgi:hypothetical protein
MSDLIQIADNCPHIYLCICVTGGYKNVSDLLYMFPSTRKLYKEPIVASTDAHSSVKHETYTSGNAVKTIPSNSSALVDGGVHSISRRIEVQQGRVDANTIRRILSRRAQSASSRDCNRIGNSDNLDVDPTEVGQGVVAYLCGPRAFVENVEHNLLDMHVAKTNIKYEKWW